MDGWQFGPAQELRRAFILDDTKLGPIQWCCPGKSAVVVMSVDDIFPGTSQSAYEAGGDLGGGGVGLCRGVRGARLERDDGRENSCEEACGAIWP